jgi:probable F420-dependent oxidoreductase
VRFGVLLPTQLDRTSRDPIAATKALARTAEHAGFDFVAVGQHRFTPGYSSAPLVTLAALASVTERVGLCTAVLLLPLHHALEVAEQVAQLDELSGGRVILGIGIGYRRYEFDAVGIPFAERAARTDEALQVLHAAWTQDVVDFHGQFVDIEGVSVEPKPIQRPRPPIWVAARLPAAVARAARLGDGWVTGLSQRVSDIATLSVDYRASAVEHGRTSTLCLMRHLGIARTRREVEDQWLAPALRFYLDYWEAGARADKDPELIAKIRAGGVSLAEFADDRAVAGTPDDCIEQIAAYRSATGCEQFCIALQAASAEGYAQAVELFGREVIRAFDDRGN